MGGLDQGTGGYLLLTTRHTRIHGGRQKRPLTVRIHRVAAVVPLPRGTVGSTVHADVDGPGRARLPETLHWNAVATVLVVVVGIQLVTRGSVLADHIILKRMTAQCCEC